MNTDRRVVPAHHVTSVLAEESISERTITMRETLGNSRIKLDQVAHKWSKNDGMNSLSRVIIMYIGKIPKKHHTPLPVTKIIHDEIPSVHHEIHDKKSTSKSTREEHVDHGHGNHVPLSRGEKVENKHGGLHHGDIHSHGHDHHEHSHDSHGSDAPLIKGGRGDLHSHGEEHGHSHFASFMSTGHWFGDQGAFIFGMIGRLIGEVLGYILKLMGLMMFFGPTRTMILVILGCILLNTMTDTAFPAWIAGGVFGIIHLIFSGIHRISGGGGGGHGEESHGGGHGESHGHH